MSRKEILIDPKLARREALAFGFYELQVTAQHAFSMGALPGLHKDPFDRMLIAQARVEGVHLLTVDTQVKKCFVQ